jgi:hypothetical protein
MEFLFPEVLRILVAVFLVVALIKFLAWLVRGLGYEQTGLRADGAKPALSPRPPAASARYTGKGLLLS